MFVCFDIDDTLLDHSRAERLAAAQFFGALRSDGYKVPGVTSEGAFVERWCSLSEKHMTTFLAGRLSFQGQRRERMRELLDKPLEDAEADGLFEGYLASYEASWQPFPDVLACLDALAEHRLGVISNGNRVQQLAKLEALGVRERFEVVITSEDTGVSKPNPAIFGTACALSGEVPGRCVYVGDRLEVDVLGAQAAGWTGVWLQRGTSPTPSAEVPVLSSLSELPAYLHRFAS